MKRLIVLFVMIVMVMGASVVPVDAKTSDKGLVKQYCSQHYKLPPKYVKEGSKAVIHRVGKPYVVVEVLKTVSKGKWGKLRDGGMVRYPKKIKKGKRVTVYLIYSPNDNCWDGVDALVAKGKVK
jgi:hypothetical protein